MWSKRLENWHTFLADGWSTSFSLMDDPHLPRWQRIGTSFSLMDDSHTLHQHQIPVICSLSCSFSPCLCSSWTALQCTARWLAHRVLRPIHPHLSRHLVTAGVSHFLVTVVSHWVMVSISDWQLACLKVQVALADNFAVVIGLQTTGEASMDQVTNVQYTSPDLAHLFEAIHLWDCWIAVLSLCAVHSIDSIAYLSKLTVLGFYCCVSSLMYYLHSLYLPDRFFTCTRHALLSMSVYLCLTFLILCLLVTSDLYLWLTSCH